MTSAAVARFKALQESTSRDEELIIAKLMEDSDAAMSSIPLKMSDLLAVRKRWRPVIVAWEEKFEALHGKPPGPSDRRRIRAWYVTYRAVVDTIRRLRRENRRMGE